MFQHNYTLNAKTQRGSSKTFMNMRVKVTGECNDSVDLSDKLRLFGGN